MAEEVELIKRRLLAKLVSEKRRPKCETFEDTPSLQPLSKCKAAVVDFWAPWCAPCRLVEPVLKRLEVEYGERVGFARVNVDVHRGLAAEMAVMGVPTVVVLSRGREVDRIVGYTPTMYARLKSTLERLLRG